MGKLLSFIVIGALTFALTSFQFDSPEGSSTLTIKFDNIRNKDGKLYVFLYNYENQYPENPYKYFEIDKSKISSYGTYTYSISNLAIGKYAVSIVDDENVNDDLDMFLGIPTEGYGFSNNVAPFFSMPDYEDLLFNINSTKKTINLTLQYIL